MSLLGYTTGAKTNRSLLKHPRLSKQVVLLQNTSLEFQILSRADSKDFLLAH